MSDLLLDALRVDYSSTMKISRQAADRIEHLESALERLGDFESDFINPSKYFATRGDYLEEDHKVRIEYAQGALNAERNKNKNSTL